MTKEEIRKHISGLKNQHLQTQDVDFSFEIFSKLEALPAFISSTHVLVYHSLPDEVQTHNFLDKWSVKKNILLPVVVGNDLKIRKYNGTASCKTGKFSILEPIGEDFEQFHLIDLTIVPGVAFDLKCNRLGRGKGYYDRLLPQLCSPKIGVCFDFQLVESIPASSWDIPMDIVLTETKFIVRESN